MAADKGRRLDTLLDLGGVRDYVVHDRDFDTAVHAVVERIFLCKGPGDTLVPPPTGERLAKDEKLRDLFKQLGDSVRSGPRVDVEGFLSYYTGRRRAVYERAVKSLAIRPVVQEDAHVSFFVKAEKADATEKVPVPRAIQPRNPRYNVEIGRYLKPREHGVYEAINEMYGATVVCKGQNAVERAKTLRQAWDSLRQPVAVFLDVSRFDQHVSVDALELEHLVYRRIYRGDKELAELLRWQLRNKGFYRSGGKTLKYQVRGRRMSGDMNTAMGNVILMCMMMKHWINVSGVTATIADDGDDCCLFMEQKDLGKLNEGVAPLVPFFREMGFTLKVEGTTDVFERIKFCQAQPVFDGARWVMVRGLNSLDKDRHSVRPVNNEGEWQKLRGSIAACGLALAGNMPVFGEFYLALGRGTDYGRSSELESGMDYLARGLTGGYTPPTAECRASFWAAFGVLPEEQIALETVYRTMEVAYWASPREVVMKSSPHGANSAVPVVDELRRGE